MCGRSAPARVIVCRVWKRRTSCPDRFVIVYDYVPGSTLAQIAEENGRLAPNVAVQLIDQICEAVQELHQHGVIHRDITPANVIVAQDGAHSSISASRASGQRQATVHGIPRRLAPTDSPRLSNMALPKPTRVPTYSRWAGYSVHADRRIIPMPATTSSDLPMMPQYRLDYAPSSAMRAHSSPANGHRASKSFARRCSPVNPPIPNASVGKSAINREQRTAARRRLTIPAVCT